MHQLVEGLSMQRTLVGRRSWLQAVRWVLGIGLSLSLLWSYAMAEEDAASSSSRSTRRTAAKTAGGMVESKIERQLSEILKNQEKILENQATIFQRFDAVMEELRIVKVRSLIGTGSGS